MDDARRAALVAVLAALEERTRYHRDRVANDPSPFIPFSKLTPHGQVLNTVVGSLRDSEVRCPLTKGAPLFGRMDDNAHRDRPLGTPLSMEDALSLRDRFKIEVLGIPLAFEAQVYNSETAMVGFTLDELWALWNTDRKNRLLAWLNPAWVRASALKCGVIQPLGRCRDCGANAYGSLEVGYMCSKCMGADESNDSNAAPTLR